MKNKKTVLVISAALIAVMLVFVVYGVFYRAVKEHEHGVSGNTLANEILYWTCSMHPEIQLPDPGLCPVCAMALIPLYKDDMLDEDIPAIELTEARAMLAAVQTSQVKKRGLSLELRLLGKVSYDERKMAEVSAWMPGRVEKLYVDFAGDFLRKGELLLRIYSPELKVAQEWIDEVDAAKDDFGCHLRNEAYTWIGTALRERFAKQ